MSSQPVIVDTITQQLIGAGIAQRMLTGSHQGRLPVDPYGCKFWVEVLLDDEESEEMRQ